MKMIITTWDKSSYILKNFAWLADKYIPEFEDITILGYSLFPNIPKRFKCVSIGDKQKSWSMDIYNYIKNISDKFIIFGIDDMLPIKNFDYDIFNEVLEMMKEDITIGRYELGVGHTWHGEIKKVKSYLDWYIYEYGEESQYRISTQFSVWRTDYLLKYLKNYWNPWQFELDGSKQATHDGYKIIATKGKYAFQWCHCLSSTRYPNMVNVEGLEKDVDEMISLDLFNIDILQLGEYPNSPKYKDSSNYLFTQMKYDLQKWTNLLNSQNFSFVKFGDGEFTCMSLELSNSWLNLGPDSLNCDEHSYSIELGEKLINSYEFLTSLNNVYIGNWDRGFEDIRKKLTFNKNINFVHFEILLTRNLFEEKFIFFKTIKQSKRNKIFVGPERLRMVINFLNIDKMITIPLKNSFSEYDKILNNCILELKEDNIYLFSAGMITKSLISELLKINQNITCLDIGSGFDIMFVGETREGQNLDSLNFYKELLEK